MEFYFKNPKIFILSGKAQSGKNIFANMIEEYYKDKKCIQISYAYYLKMYAKKILNWNGNESSKPREFLQNLGIDLIKSKIDDKLLIRRICEDIKIYSYFFDIIILTDARLINEIKIPIEMFKNTVTIRINRNNYDNKLTILQKNHLTETNLDNFDKFDYIIENDENFKQSIEKILEEQL